MNYTHGFKESEDLINSYNRFLPYKAINLLQKDSFLDIKLGDHIEKNITIMFCDIRDFTTISKKLTPQENFNFINSYLLHMEPIITKKWWYHR